MAIGSSAVAPSRSARTARTLAFGVAAASAALAATLYWAPYWVRAAWPWPENAMSFVFLASIMASIAMVWLSVAFTGEVAALAGVGINIAAANLGVCLYLALQAWSARRGELVPAALLGAMSVLFGAGLWRWAARVPLRDPRPMPVFVRGAFVAFVVTLIVAGSTLALQRQVFPWPLQPQTATLFGFIFLGAAAYFAHAVVHGRWAFAVPPLLGFLAYDLVLFVPYCKLLVDPGAGDDFYGGSPVNRTSLVIYLAVLASSALLALHALLIHPATRWRPGRGASAR